MELKVEEYSENIENLEKVEEDKSSWGGKRERAGRKAGVPNKVSRQVKENVVEVFDRIGGVDHMVRWAQEYPTEFYKFYVKMMPTQSEISGMDGEELPINIGLRFINPEDDR